jgi:hypothetical protein
MDHAGGGRGGQTHYTHVLEYAAPGRSLRRAPAADLDGSSDASSDSGDDAPHLADGDNSDDDGPTRVATASPTNSSPPMSPSRLARERERAREAAEALYTRDVLFARAGMMFPPPVPRGRDPLAGYPTAVTAEEEKREQPRLQAGEPVFWHHLARGGEIPGVRDDRRARPPPPTAPVVRARFQR